MKKLLGIMVLGLLKSYPIDNDTIEVQEYLNIFLT